MKLSPHFTLAEMTVSQTAARRGIDNTPDKTVIANLTDLCENVLEPVRNYYKKPVIVTSGYRSKKLNSAIGGSKTSDHCFGYAADFTVQGVSNLEVCDWIHKNLNYKQLIAEFIPASGFGGWIHCSYDKNNMKNQELRAVKQRRYGIMRTVYLNGLR